MGIGVGHLSLSVEGIVSKSSKHTLGYILIISSAALFALTHVIGKPLLEDPNFGVEINPIALVATIYIINGLFFTPLSKNSGPIKDIGKRNLILITLIGIAEVSALISYFFGLKESTAVNASIFSNGEIIFSLLIAITIFKERLHKKELTPFFMIIFGMMILPIGYDFWHHGMALSDLVIGDLLIIFSGLLYAIDVNICKYVSDRVSSNRITQLVSFTAGGFALALLVAFQIPYEITWEQLAPISLIAILGTGLATVFFLMALKLIGAVRTVLIYSTTSVFGIIFSAIILAEQITMVNIISISTVMVGIYFLRKRFGEHEEPKQLNEDGKIIVEKTEKYKPKTEQLYWKFSDSISKIENYFKHKMMIFLFDYYNIYEYG